MKTPVKKYVVDDIPESYIIEKDKPINNKKQENS